ncbi:PD-(D/E)XK nuclease family transposase [Sulfurovum sp. bin170]|uniref:Rpn family recombination-promoting nuclease/putative transposase n=1 Tax=Sulfurovum sp. bin170 TaxID=2695268 RepID=UPI0013DF4D96|nr:Rpn family recombination-promoting nuclease/putative transposase [Sulfurovum sp. bin170]NEW60586.1 PD-(D/E)XK nuclease family transposase [Sulfurovum sp. bin170]
MMIKNKYIDPFTDFGFKHIFGNVENKGLLISFLNDLLDIEDKIVDITYRNLEKLGLNIIDRRAVFDVYCTDERGNNFIVELQRSKQKYFIDRSIYYTSFPIQEQSKKGDWDYRLEKVYFVGILEFKMDDNNSDDYLTKVQLMNTKSNEVFYDKLTYYYIEMPKFTKEEKELSSHLEYWMWYLNNLSKIQEIPEKLKQDKVIKKAFDVAEFLALSKDKQFAYQSDLKAKLDYFNAMSYAKEEAEKEGLRKGKEEGKEEKAIEIAKNLLLAKVDIETIVKSTSLSIDEIRELE